MQTPHPPLWTMNHDTAIPWGEFTVFAIACTAVNETLRSGLADED